VFMDYGNLVVTGFSSYSLVADSESPSS